MKALPVLFVILALGACEGRTEKAQADISKGNPEGQQMRKKYEAAQKEASDKRKEAQ